MLLKLPRPVCAGWALLAEYVIHACHLLASPFGGHKQVQPSLPLIQQMAACVCSASGAVPACVPACVPVQRIRGSACVRACVRACAAHQGQCLRVCLRAWLCVAQAIVGLLLKSNPSAGQAFCQYLVSAFVGDDSLAQGYR